VIGAFISLSLSIFIILPLKLARRSLELRLPM